MIPARTKYLAVIPFFYFLSIFGLAAAGLLGPDEPRYASIGREMAVSGDWITPRLWGEPWFEKPPLLYWMAAAGFRAGLGAEWAPRLPVALTGIAFLLFFFAVLWREFGELPAFYSTMILATSAGWVAFSHAAATDLPLAAAFAASMLLALIWLRRESRPALVAGGVLLGLAILAKGLVPLVLAVPLFWFGRRRIPDLLLFLAVAFVTAAPWYVAVTMRHGSEFINEFFWKHHFERFASESLRHVRPFWFYIPVILAGIFPWTPLLLLLFRRSNRDVARRFLIAVVVFGFVFFSLSTNKLPGYLLPLFPPLCALLGITLAEVKPKDRARPVVLLALCAAFLGFVPIAGSLLPRALQSGLSGASWQGSWLAFCIGLALAAVVWFAFSRGRSTLAVSTIGAAAVAGVVYLKIVALPQVDRAASSRSLWQEVKPVSDFVCVGGAIHRNWRYGLNYYSEKPLPDCASGPAKLEINQQSGDRPELRSQW